MLLVHFMDQRSLIDSIVLIFILFNYFLIYDIYKLKLFKMQKHNLKNLILTVSLACICMLAVNYQIERIIKQPFTNSVIPVRQRFNSPLSLMVFTSALIWIYGSLWQFSSNLTKKKIINRKDQVQVNQEEFQSQYQLVQQNNNQINCQKEPESYQQKVQNDLVLLSKLPKLEMLKIVLPTFLQLLCFMYTVEYLNFPKTMIFSIFTRLGLLNLYQSLFKDEPNRAIKFLIGGLTILGFGLFNLTLFSESEQQKDQKNNTQVLAGNMFAIGMCYLGLIKKILHDKVQEEYGKLQSFDNLMVQAKVNSILGHLLCFFLKQEIYGSVFALLHYQFFWTVLAFSMVLFAGIIVKKKIKTIFGDEFQNFTNIQQKNLSLIFSILYFEHKINRIQKFGIAVITLASFIDLIKELKNYKTEFKKKNRS